MSNAANDNVIPLFIAHGKGTLIVPFAGYVSGMPTYLKEFGGFRFIITQGTAVYVGAVYLLDVAAGEWKVVNTIRHTDPATILSTLAADIARASAPSLKVIR